MKRRQKKKNFKKSIMFFTGLNKLNKDWNVFHNVLKGSVLKKKTIFPIEYYNPIDDDGIYVISGCIRYEAPKRPRKQYCDIDSTRVCKFNPD